MISRQNTTLPHLGADIRPAQPEPLTAATVAGSVNLLAARDAYWNRQPSAKHTATVLAIMANHEERDRC